MSRLPAPLLCEPEAGPGAPGMIEWLEVKVLYGALVEATVSIRQLHKGRRFQMEPRPESARMCGMEAGSEPRRRTKVKSRKAGLGWVSVLGNATPVSSRGRTVLGTAAAGSCSSLPWEISPSPRCGREPGNRHSMLGEKSDHPIRVVRPGNAGGTRGVMG
jgi:hypothetical protein